jgi:vacuolar-type H+-ATPase subunit E/Vma4
MTAAVLIPSAQSGELLRELERETQAECQALISAAEQEARAIVARARGDATERTHAAIVLLRQEGRRRLLRAKAQADTELRLRAHRDASAAIAMAWPLLEAALLACWHDPASRRLWAESALRHAAARLLRGPWKIEHPTDWSESERQSLPSMLPEDGSVKVEFKADADVAAGLRIRAGQALLDATLQGLLADRAAVAAALLAEVEARSEG